MFEAIEEYLEVLRMGAIASILTGLGCLIILMILTSMSDKVKALRRELKELHAEVRDVRRDMRALDERFQWRQDHR